jgi:hypothetical protein
MNAPLTAEQQGPDAWLVEWNAGTHEKLCANEHEAERESLILVEDGWEDVEVIPLFRAAAVETQAPHVTLLCTDPEIRALFNKAIGVQYRNKFSYSFETEGEAERAFHFIGSLGELQMSRPPPETTAELARYKQALQRANGFLIMHELEPVKLEYSSEKDCEVCHGSGEIVFNKQGGDPAYDESKPCPECSTAGGGHG